MLLYWSEIDVTKDVSGFQTFLSGDALSFFPLSKSMLGNIVGVSKPTHRERNKISPYVRKSSTTLDLPPRQNK